MKGLCKLVKAGQKAFTLARYIALRAVVMFGDIGFGEMQMIPEDVPQVASMLRKDHGNSKASEVRHVIFSTPKKSDPIEAKKVLHGMAVDWIATYAPGRPWMAGEQDHNETQHLHLAVGVVGEDGEPLQFRPHQVIAMSEMKFTKHAVSSKGPGPRKDRLKVYTKSRDLSVRDLAEMLLTPGGATKRDRWKQLAKEGTIGDFRTRKNGEVISFVFQSRRIRVSTLNAFLASPASTKARKVTPKPKAAPTSLERDLQLARRRRSRLPTQSTKPKNKGPRI